jgi:hypothetical protein
MNPLHVADPTTFIATALAPAVALSAIAILTSNAQTKYSSMVDRLRQLNAERRDLQGPEAPTASEALRLKSLDRQIALLFRRARHLRDAIFLLFAALACIILTSFLIAAMEYLRARNLALLPKWTFLAGLLLVFFALIEELLEVRLTFRVVRYELGLFDHATAKEVEKNFRGV